MEGAQSRMRLASWRRGFLSCIGVCREDDKVTRPFTNSPTPLLTPLLSDCSRPRDRGKGQTQFLLLRSFRCWGRATREPALGSW